MKKTLLMMMVAMMVAFVGCQPDTPDDGGKTPIEHYVTVESDTLYLGYEASADNVLYVESHDSFWEYTYDESVEWCMISDIVDELGIHHFSIEVLENTTGESRELTVTVTNGEAADQFVIVQLANQSKPATTITTSESSYTVTKEFITLQVEVVADGEYEVVIPEGCDWITSDGATESEGKRTEALFVAANFGDDIRSAEVTFRSLNTSTSIEITQWGKTEIYVEAEQKKLVYLAGRDSLHVNAIAEYAVTVESGEWLKVNKELSSPEYVVFDFEENPSESEERDAVIKLEAANTVKTVTLTQLPYSPTEMPDNDTWVEDIAGKVTAVEGTSQMSASRNAAKAADGNIKSLWYSAIDSDTAQELTLTIDASMLDRIDYLRYEPVTGSMSWGRWGETDIYATDANGVETLVKSFDFGCGACTVNMPFEPALPNTTTKLRIVIKNAEPYTDKEYSNSNVASAAEVGVYMYDASAFLALDYFTDWSLSELRDGVSYDDICGIKDPFYRGLAEKIMCGDYDDEFRVCEFKAYPRPERDAVILRDKPFGVLDNVTGMFVLEPNVPQYVYLDEDYGQEIYVRVVDWMGHEDAGSTSPDSHVYDYRIQKGRNVFVPKYRGLMYILCFTDNYENIPEMKAHFVNSAVNGYIKKGEHTPADVRRIFLQAPASEEPRFDVVSNRAVLNFAKDKYYTRTFKKDIDANAARVFELMDIYDSIHGCQDYITGLVKYRAMGLPRHHRNRMTYADVVTGALGYSGHYLIGFNDTYSQFVDPKELWDRNATTITQNTIMNYGRVVSHELGHSTQTEMFTWRGQIEVTNNLMCAITHNLWWGEGAGYSMLSYGDRFSGATKDVATRWVWDFDSEGNWFERPVTYVESVNCPPYGQSENGGQLETRMMPLYQLYLFNHLILGNRDFYPDYYESCRTKDFNQAKFGNNSDKYQSALLFEFVRGISEVSGLNWSKWAKRWGIPGINDRVKVSHYGSNRITTTAEEIADMEAYCAKYPEPELDPFYIHDHNIELYRNPKPVVAGTHSVNSYGKFTTEGWENVAAWLLVDPDKKEADGTQGRVVAVVSCNNPSGESSFNYAYRESRYVPRAEGDYAEYKYSNDDNTNRSMERSSYDYDYTATLQLYAVDVYGKRYASKSNTR